MATHAWQNSQKFLASQLIGFWLIFGLALLAGQALGLGLSEAHADSTEGAQAGMSKAYNDYYRAIRAQPSSSPSDAAKLSKEILEPAQQKLRQAISESTQQTLKSIAPPKEPYIKTTHWGTKARMQKKGTKSPTPISQPTPPKKAATPVAPIPEPPATHEPETVLDGSNVPREIEFPGPAKPKPSPSKAK